MRTEEFYFFRNEERRGRGDITCGQELPYLGKS